MPVQDKPGWPARVEHVRDASAFHLRRLPRLPAGRIPDDRRAGGTAGLCAVRALRSAAVRLPPYGLAKEEICCAATTPGHGVSVVARASPFHRAPATPYKEGTISREYRNVPSRREDCAEAGLAKEAPFNWEDPLDLEGELSEEERMVRDTARGFAQDKLLPQIIKAYREERFDRAVISQMGELGLLGPTIPEEYGGAGLGYVAATA